MSVQSWCEEFYPKYANDTTRREAVQHSLQKWIGLLPRNLKKHECTLSKWGDIIDADTFNSLEIDAETCALCRHYQRDDCGVCPLYLVRGKVSCSDRRNREKKSPYQKGAFEGKPTAMIGWLRRALKFEQKKLATQKRKKTHGK